MQHQCQTIAIQFSFDIGCRECIGIEELDRFKACCPCFIKTLHEWNFVVQHGEIGGKLGHSSSFMG